GAGAAVRIGFSGMGIIEPIQVLALQLVPRNEPLGEYREGKPVVKAEVHGNPQPEIEEQVMFPVFQGLVYAPGRRVQRRSPFAHAREQELLERRGRQARQEGAQLDRNLYAVLAEREGGAFHDVAAAIGEIIGIAGQAVIAYAVRHDPQTVGLPAEARKSVVEGKSGTTR